MSGAKTENGFTGFVCPSCGTEIEASFDMCGTEAECPACAAKIKIPDRPPVEVPVSDKLSRAMKSRTIRIELGGI